MIAAVILVLVLVSPGAPAHTESFPMPSLDVCKAAMAEFLGFDPDRKQDDDDDDEDEEKLHRMNGSRPMNGRSAACLTINAEGTDS
jgi:hypothetical protein